jgi:SAM-dependent methyltransferase
VNTSCVISSNTTQVNPTSIRQIERESIRSFVERYSYYLCGHVLDFGCGKPGTCREPQPYRSLITGDYYGQDVGDKPITEVNFFDAIVCTQVIQYIHDPMWLLGQFKVLLKADGYLVMSYPTNWDEVEDTDYWRFTKAGMNLLLSANGFRTVHHERRAEVELSGFRFPLGYGVVAQA